MDWKNRRIRISSCKLGILSWVGFERGPVRGVGILLKDCGLINMNRPRVVVHIYRYGGQRGMRGWRGSYGTSCGP